MIWYIIWEPENLNLIKSFSVLFFHFVCSKYKIYYIIFIKSMTGRQVKVLIMHANQNTSHKMVQATAKMLMLMPQKSSFVLFSFLLITISQLFSIVGYFNSIPSKQRMYMHVGCESVFSNKIYSQWLKKVEWSVESGKLKTFSFYLQGKSAARDYFLICKIWKFYSEWSRNE